MSCVLPLCSSPGLFFTCHGGVGGDMAMHQGVDGVSGDCYEFLLPSLNYGYFYFELFLTTTHFVGDS